MARKSKCSSIPISVCSSILSHAKATEEMDVETQVRTRALKMLCQMNPSYIRDLRVQGVTLCKLAGLVIELSIQTKIKGTIDTVLSFFRIRKKVD